MSNHLAIANVTAAIGQFVQAAVKGSVVGDVALQFGRPAAPAPETSRVIHAYLYNVSHDPAKRNADLPSRGPDGNLVQRPRAALILHYLLTFYGDSSKLEPQRMLAAVARDLYARPILTAEFVTGAIDAHAPDLDTSDLGAAPEPVRLNQRTLSLEELSKLWSVMVQTPYALSLACDAAVVLIDALETAPAPLPALRRGEADRGPEAQAGRFPMIELLWIGLPGSADLTPRPPSLPLAQLGVELVIRGSSLAGDVVAFEFKHPLFDAATEIIAAPNGADSFRLTLPDSDPGAPDWAAGLYAVTAVVTRDGKQQRSAVWPMVLAPRIDDIDPVSLDRNGGPAVIKIKCRPQIQKKQSAELLVSNLPVPAEARAGATDTLSFLVDPVPLALKAHRIFLRVDGADSQPFLLHAGGGFEFDDAQRLAIT